MTASTRVALNVRASLFAALWDTLRHDKQIKGGNRGAEDVAGGTTRTAAMALIEHVSESGAYYVTDEEPYRAGLAEAERGEIADEGQVREVYKRIGL